MSASKRISTIEKLDRQRLTGVRSQSFLDAHEDIFERRRRAYYAELVNQTRKTGEVNAAAVFKMVALDDLLTELDADVAIGRAASRKLDEMAENPPTGGGAEPVDEWDEEIRESQTRPPIKPTMAGHAFGIHKPEAAISDD